MGIFNDIIETKNQIRNQTGQDPEVLLIGLSAFTKMSKEFNKSTLKELEAYLGIPIVIKGTSDEIVLLKEEEF